MTKNSKLYVVMYTAIALALGVGMSVSCSKSGFKSKSGGGGNGGSNVPEFEKRERNSTDQESEEGSANTDDDASTAETEKDIPLDKSKVNSVYAFKKMRSLNATFQHLTGVQNNGQADPGDNQNNKPVQNVGQVFNGLRAGLPKSGIVKNLSPTDISAVTKLAMAYCIALVGDQALSAEKFPGLNLAGDKNTLINDTAADALVNAFWHMDLENAPDIAEAKGILTTLFNDLKADPTVDSAAQLMIAGCSVALSSPVVALK